MSDAAFKSPPYSAYLTAELKKWIADHDKGRKVLTYEQEKTIRKEIERRARVDAGDRSSMTDAERLRWARAH